MAKINEMVKEIQSVKGSIVINDIFDDVNIRHASKTWRKLNEKLPKKIMKRICFRKDDGELFTYIMDEDTLTLARVTFTYKPRRRSTTKKTGKKKTTAKKAAKKKTTKFTVKVVFLNQVKEIEYTSFEDLKKSVGQEFGIRRFTINQLYDEDQPNGLPDFKRFVELGPSVNIEPDKEIFVSIKADGGSI